MGGEQNIRLWPVMPLKRSPELKLQNIYIHSFAVSLIIARFKQDHHFV
jgi:hypothetical protein